ncbi:zinc finger CCCH domain-containing protein 17 isoform X7 [Salvia hispanica]|uniref:zinc finger CCCH domain-containing protein 17 isoform X7 n=1 Tax=Salvia hispanica TaxID=49212 RepID=UPI0020096729|nr:zinc finger CCCH domain-containing protein 17 isoform X7 [Salvia hispanica]
MKTGELNGGRMAGDAAPQPPSAEEEALKKSTDCVYFLASPLTCIKGHECEYRHSDFARLNPRDCWFWLNSNCLNPSCGFRHPPLGLLGTQLPTPSGSAQPLPQTAAMTPVQVMDANSIQGVPCKFFQSGLCLKGDWCSFTHTPNSMRYKASVVPVKAVATEPSNLNKVDISVLGKKIPPPTNKSKPIMCSLDQQLAAGEVKPDVRSNELPKNKRMIETSCINELPNYNSRLVSNENVVRVKQPYQMDDPGMIDDKNVGDDSREPSPGFDVLVDDEGRDSDFFLSEDQYGMSREYEAQNNNENNNLTEEDIFAEADNDRYRYIHGYEPQGYPRGQYGLEQNRASSERMSAGHNGRPYGRGELDLRDCLTRKKQHHGLRSVICREQVRDKLANDHSHERYAPRHEDALSNRLQGRIRFPRRSSYPADREMIRRADNGRLSSANGWKNHKGPHFRRVKNHKESHYTTDQQQPVKRKYDTLERNGSSVSFEGPKPLEEILKRKKGEGTVSIRNSSEGENGSRIGESSVYEQRD